MTRSNNSFALIVASILLIFLDYFQMLRFIRNPLDRVVIPVKRNIYLGVLILRNFSDTLIQYPRYQEIISLEKKLRQEKEEYEWQLKVLGEENEKLRFQLGAPYPATYQFIPAQVISVVKTMEINAGVADGVKTGMAVVDGRSYIGKVVEVKNQRSQVMMLSDIENATGAKTQRGVMGKVVGHVDGSIILDKVLQKDPLFLDDLVVTSGEDNIPANLVIGKIVYITSEDADPYKQAKIEPAVDAKKESLVLVITI